MNYIVSIEGQRIELPEAIATNDDKIKAALAGFFPGAANSKIQRNDPVDGTMIIDVIKQAGTKGSDDEVITALAETPASENSAVTMWQQIDAKNINRLRPDERLLIDDQIKGAVDDGEEEEKAILKALNSLRMADAAPLPVLAEGF